MLNVCVFGAAGRMGQSLIRSIQEAPDLQLVGALVEPGDALSGHDVGVSLGLGEIGVLATDQPVRALDQAQVAIDFTLPKATLGNIKACEESEVALVTGTTGFSDDQNRLLRGREWTIPAVFAPNMSIGVNLMYGLIAQAATSLGADYDIEIIETHHRHKKDAPSGTALALGEVISESLDVSLSKAGVFHREGQAPRRAGDIGFSVVRAGDVVGEHTVLFATEGERLEITHRASSRQTFVNGALRSARWVVEQKPGLFGMADVLGLAGAVDT